MPHIYNRDSSSSVPRRGWLWQKLLRGNFIFRPTHLFRPFPLLPRNPAEPVGRNRLGLALALASTKRQSFRAETFAVSNNEPGRELPAQRHVFGHDGLPRDPGLR